MENMEFTQRNSRKILLVNYIVFCKLVGNINFLNLKNGIICLLALEFFYIDTLCCESELVKI